MEAERKGWAVLGRFVVLAGSVEEARAMVSAWLPNPAAGPVPHEPVDSWCLEGEPEWEAPGVPQGVVDALRGILGARAAGEDGATDDYARDALRLLGASAWADDDAAREAGESAYYDGEAKTAAASDPRCAAWGEGWQAAYVDDMEGGDDDADSEGSGS